jgi:tRNA(adenine34) deaminase
MGGEPTLKNDLITNTYWMQEILLLDVKDAVFDLKLPKMSENDALWMQKAIDAAHEAEQHGEVPVGAVILDADGELLAIASNRTITDNDPTAHAEILALRSAAAKIDNYRLTGATLYTTIEPCVMCAGALVNARISRLVFGSRDERFGGVVTKFRLCDNEVLNHRMELTEGVLAVECRALMQEFFKARR